jgi:hypothetical protein
MWNGIAPVNRLSEQRSSIVANVVANAGLVELFCSKIVPMDVAKRLALALDRCPLSGRDIAAELTRRGHPTSHTTVNRWRNGQVPRLDEAAILADIAGVDLVWVMYGEGPPPWELSDEQRRILWLADVVGLDEAAARLAAATAPAGPARLVARVEETELVRRQLKASQSSRRDATTKGPRSRTDQPDSDTSGDRSQSKRDIQR